MLIDKKNMLKNLKIKKIHLYLFKKLSVWFEGETIVKMKNSEMGIYAIKAKNVTNVDNENL